MNELVRWVADQVERRPIEALVPYARNARVHSEDQVARIAASMERWGGRCRFWSTRPGRSLPAMGG
jgi:hypothetical protein